MSYGGLADLLSELALDDLVLKRWTATGAQDDPVGALEQFLTALLFEPIDLRLAATYLEFFTDRPDLRVPLSDGALSPPSRDIVQALQRGAPQVFASNRINTVGFTFTYSRYRGNGDLNARFPRRSVVLTVLAKGLCVARHRGLLPEFAVVALCALDRATTHSACDSTTARFLCRTHTELRLTVVAWREAARRPQALPTASPRLALPPGLR